MQTSSDLMVTFKQYFERTIHLTAYFYKLAFQLLLIHRQLCTLLSACIVNLLCSLVSWRRVF